MLKFATLSYGRKPTAVRPTESLPLPAEFDFENAEECARTILAIMANAAGGHPLRDCRLSLDRERRTANITGSGAHVFYAPAEGLRKMTIAEIEATAKRLQVIQLGHVMTDQYGGGWKRAAWIPGQAAAAVAA